MSFHNIFLSLPVKNLLSNSSAIKIAYGRSYCAAHPSATPQTYAGGHANRYTRRARHLIRKERTPKWRNINGHCHGGVMARYGYIMGIIWGIMKYLNSTIRLSIVDGLCRQICSTSVSSSLAFAEGPPQGSRTPSLGFFHHYLLLVPPTQGYGVIKEYSVNLKWLAVAQ